MDFFFFFVNFLLLKDMRLNLLLFPSSDVNDASLYI